MYRRLVLTLAAALGAAALTAVDGHAATPAEIKKAGVVKVVTTSSSPPHGFLDAKTRSLKGIMVEVAQAVGRDLGVKVEFTEVPFGALIPTLTSKRADLMSAPLFITPQRAEVVDFSDPIYGWGEGLAVQTGSTKTYGSLQSLSGSTAGVLVNSVQYNLVKDVPGVKDVRTYPDYIQLLADLRAGRIDVAMIDPPSIAYQMKLHGITGVKLVEGYTPVNAWKIGMAVDKGDRELLEAVNASLRKLKASGELKRILDGWDVGQLIAK